MSDNTDTTRDADAPQPGDALHTEELLTDSPDPDEDTTEETMTDNLGAPAGADEAEPPTGHEATAPTAPEFPDIAQLSYEDARDQLVAVVQRLESGQAPLDETMNLWERGEALADHCARWLDRAEQRLEQSAAGRPQ